MRSAVLIGVLGACSFENRAPDMLADTAPDVAIDGAVDAPLSTPWGTPTVVAIMQPHASDDDPSPTDDQLELFINTNRANNADIHVVTRMSTASAWSAPTLVPLVSSNANETTPEVAYDGLSIIVASDRVGTTGGNDLWISTRPTRTAPWVTPVRIAELSSTANEAAGNMTPDGLAVVLSSFRTGNGSPDLFMATRASTSVPWDAPVEIAAVNTSMHEGSPFLSADKLALYFDTDRNGNLDLYVSRRASTTEPFGAPEPIAEIDTASDEQDPWLSADGRRLMFSSNRSGTNQLWEATR